MLWVVGPSDVGTHPHAINPREAGAMSGTQVRTRFRGSTVAVRISRQRRSHDMLVSGGFSVPSPKWR